MNQNSLYWTFYGDNVTVSGINFMNANMTSYNLNNYHAVLKFINSSNSRVEDCSFSNLKSYGILAGNSTDVVISNCNFTNGSSRMFSITNSSVTVEDSIMKNFSTSYIRNSTFTMVNSTVTDFNDDDIFNFANTDLDIRDNTFKNLTFPNKTNFQRFGVFYAWDDNAGIS